MSPQQYSWKTVSPTNLHVTKVLKVLRIHFIRAACNIIVGLLTAVLAIAYLGWNHLITKGELNLQSILFLIIALPPAILCGNVWVQICRKHPQWLEQTRSLGRLLFLARTKEPALFWLGIVGGIVVCGLTYILASIPSNHSLWSWIGTRGFIVEISALYLTMIGIAEIPDLLHLRRHIRQQRRQKRVSARLAYSFLEQYDNHKN